MKSKRGIKNRMKEKKLEGFLMIFLKFLQKGKVYTTSQKSMSNSNILNQKQRTLAQTALSCDFQKMSYSYLCCDFVTAHRTLQKFRFS